jgi:hypothetical protein
MNVLVKCYHPEYYEAANSAVIEVTENVILMLDKRLAQAKAMNDKDFYGTKWWDYTPDFVFCKGPDSIGLAMDEEEFDKILDANGYICFADDFDLEKLEDAPMRPVVLTVTANGFYWTGTDKYIGNEGRVETYELGASTIDEWAESLGCEEMLAKVRACRGEVKDEGNS